MDYITTSRAPIITLTGHKRQEPDNGQRISGIYAKRIRSHKNKSSNKQSLTYTIDKESKFSFKIEYNKDTRELKGCWVDKIPLGDDLKKLHATLQKHLHVKINNINFDKTMGLNGSEYKIEIFIGDHLLLSAIRDLEQNNDQLIQWNPLNSYDLRRLNQEEDTYLQELAHRNTEKKPPTLIADLHTHFGGAIRAETFEKVIRTSKKPVMYPVELLKKMHVSYFGEVDENGQINLASPQTQIMWNRFKDALTMHPLRISTFPDMEEVYQYRGPLVKNIDLFEAFLEELAKDYQKNGVEYAELSISDIIKPEWISIANQVILQLEKKYGVKLRFLVGIWRHSPEKFNEDIFEKVKAYINSPYIVGVDIMGHETNSTRDFVDLLDACHEYKKNQRPDFVIRVHAGESPCHPENVFLAIQHGATRIGHGLHGFSSEVAEIAKKTGVIFELNISSNSALHSVTLTNEIPLGQLVDSGVRVTLGTDGHGCYRTDHQQESTLAMQLGLSYEQMLKIQDSDRQYIQRMSEFASRRMQNPKQAFQQPVLPAAKFPSDGWQKIETEKKEKREALTKKLENITSVVTKKNVEVVGNNQLDEVFKDRVPILFAGATSVSWEPVSLEDRAVIKNKIREFFSNLNPEKVVIITGGTDFGLELQVHDVIKEYAEKGVQFQLLGAMATELQADISTVSQSLTHAVIIDNTWYDLAPFILRWVNIRKGVSYFIGGGDVVKNMIHTAKTLGQIEYFVVNDIYGSSSKAASLYPTRSFSKRDGLSNILLKSLRREVLKSITMTVDDAVDYIRAKGKRVVTFMGKSDVLLESTLRQLLSVYNPQEVIINAEATSEGIGKVYNIAKEMNFETLGIASTKAQENQIKNVDFTILIEDESTVSEAIVRCSHEGIFCGQGDSQAIRDLGKDVLEIP